MTTRGDWTIRFVKGEYEVHKGARRKRIWPSEAQAIQWLRGKVDVNLGEKVIVIEADGYRMDITRRFTR